MKIKMKVKYKKDGQYYPPNTEIDISEVEGKKLVRAGQAEEVIISDESEEFDESDVLTDEEYKALIELLTSISSVNAEIADALIDNGYQSIESIADADSGKLIKEVKGIGQRNAPLIINSAKEILSEE